MNFLLYLLVTTLVGCGIAVKHGTDDQKNNALKNGQSASPGHRVFYFYEPRSYGYVLALYINKQKVANLDHESFTRVELPYGTHYLELHNADQSDQSISQHFLNLNIDEEIRKEVSQYSTLKLFVSRESDEPVLFQLHYHGKFFKDNEFFAYYHFHGMKKVTGTAAIQAALNKEDYSLPFIGRINGEFATAQDTNEWDLYKNTNSVDSLREFVRKHPNNIYALPAKKRLEEKEIAEKTEFKKTLDSKSPELMITFLRKNPAQERKDQVLSALSGMLEPGEYQKMATEFPAITKYYPKDIASKMALLDIGPEKMKVKDLVRYQQEGISSETLSAKIRATTSAYKDFSFSEIAALKELGVEEKVINTMINTNTEYVKQVKQAEANEKMMAQIKELIAKSEASLSQQEIRSNPNTPIECIKQQAALKACEQTSGLLRFGCEATAKSSFDCNLEY